MKRAGVLVFATALAAACGEGVTAPGELRGTITLSATEIAPAQPVTVHLTLVNTGGRQVVFEGNLCLSDFFVVTDQAGARVGPGPRVCDLYGQSIRLDPGGSFTYSYLWTVTALGPSAADPVYLPPGEYLVRAG